MPSGFSAQGLDPDACIENSWWVLSPRCPAAQALDADTDNAASSGLVQEEDTVCSVSLWV